VLGLEMTEDRAGNVLNITGCAGRIPVEGAELFLGNAGTAMRPLVAAVAAAGKGTFVLDGTGLHSSTSQLDMSTFGETHWVHGKALALPSRRISAGSISLDDD